jgi:hypothetical protein
MRLWMKLLLALLLICAIAGAGFGWRYPGISAALVDQVRYAGPRESWNNWLFAAYTASTLEQLTLNPQTGAYDFAAAGRRVTTRLDRARLAYHEGDFEAAVEALEREIAHQGESEELLFWLANAHLRLAEAENCLTTLLSGGRVSSRHAQRMCALPIEQHHQRRSSTERAAELLARLRSRYPDNRLYQWLLNFTHMTLGVYPDAVPAGDRIESGFIDAFLGGRADRLASENSDLVFIDRAAELGVDTLDAGKGVAVEDFDGDGDLDIVTGGNFDPLRYYSNVEGEAFVDRTNAAGLGDIHQVHVLTAADFDGDGWIDLFVGRPFVHYLLLRNNRDGTFSDVTEAAGLLAGWLENEISFTWASAWGDADGDGDLDLFVARWGMRLPGLEGPFAQPLRGSRLFLNEGDRFADRTAASGIASTLRDRGIVGATWGDADEDGDLDLFLSSVVQHGSYLLRNRGDASFEVDERHGPGFMTAFLDIDHDGRQEIFQGGFTDARTSTQGAVFGEVLGRPAGASSILRRDSDGRYRPDLEFFGNGAFPIATMGASWGDLDLDGCLDFYLGTGNPEGWFILPNLMFRGTRDGKRCGSQATNISMLNGFGTIQKGHGIVFFDFDNDGDQDIYSSLGGMWPGDRWPNQLFVNESVTDNRWVKIRLRGRRANRFGLGAGIMVRAVDARGEAIVRTYTMDHKTGFGSAPYLAHIGLLDAVAVQEIRVRWPGSSRVCSYPARLDALTWLDQAACVSSVARSDR